MSEFTVSPEDLEALRTESLLDPDGEAWSVWPHPDGRGYAAHHPTRGFGETRFATENDAARAVLDNPYEARLWDGGLFGDSRADEDADAA